MGFFDFLVDYGKDLFGMGGNEAEEIQKMLTTELGNNISDLQVTFEDGVVNLSGKCDSQATKEKAVLLAGNVKGVKQVSGDKLETPPVKKADETVFYTIQRGDTLSKIAKKYYGNAMKYPVLFEANREVIKDPDLIYPNQVIRIPKLPE